MAKVVLGIPDEPGWNELQRQGFILPLPHPEATKETCLCGVGLWINPDEDKWEELCTGCPICGAFYLRRIGFYRLPPKAPPTPQALQKSAEHFEQFKKSLRAELANQPDDSTDA